MLAEVESLSLDIPGLVKLHAAFAWGDDGWSDEQKRDYLLKIGYRIYFDVRSFEIRFRAGKVVAQWDESTAPIADESGQPFFTIAYDIRKAGNVSLK